MSTRIIRLFTLCVGLAICCVGPAWSAATDPTLALTEGLMATGSTRLVRVRGVFPADDLVQTDYPLQLLVRSLADGTSYVRYDLVAQTLTGSDPALADGLDAVDVPGLLASGVASSDGLVAFIGARQIDVILPASFPPGSIEAQLFVLSPNETVAIVSNALTIEGATP